MIATTTIVQNTSITKAIAIQAPGPHPSCHLVITASTSCSEVARNRAGQPGTKDLPGPAVGPRPLHDRRAQPPRRHRSPAAGPRNTESPEDERCRAIAEDDVEPLVDPDEGRQQEEPGADDRGKKRAEESHRPGECEEHTFERP